MPEPTPDVFTRVLTLLREYRGQMLRDGRITMKDYVALGERPGYDVTAREVALTLRAEQAEAREQTLIRRLERQMQVDLPDCHGAFQARVAEFLTRCFGPGWAAFDRRKERAMRFFEEACELSFASGLTMQQLASVLIDCMKKDHQEPLREIGDAMVTLVALAQSLGTSAFRRAQETISALETLGPDAFLARDREKPDHVKATGGKA